MGVVGCKIPGGGEDGACRRVEGGAFWRVESGAFWRVEAGALWRVTDSVYKG